MNAKPLSLVAIATYALLVGIMSPSNDGDSPDLADLSDGLVAHWRLDETSGEAVLDTTGNGHHGIAYGATRISGVTGGALDFDGTDDEVWVPAMGAAPPDEISTLEVGTIALWLRYEDSPQEAEPLFYIGGPAGSESGVVIEVGHPDNNNLYFTFFVDSLHPTLCFDTAFDLLPGRWYHFVGVVGADFNTGYLDGIELTGRHYTRGGPDDAYFFADLSEVERLTLGAGAYKQRALLFGEVSVDDVRIYDRPLTSAEASALHAGTEPPSNLAPDAMDDVAATTVGTSVVIDVLANDSDADGDSLIVTSVGDPGAGTTSTDGMTVTYVPDPDWVGVDTFTYTIADPAGAVDTATVTVTTQPAETCNGLQATIVGTSEGEEIEGTSGVDVIVAKGGADVVNAKGGADVICGGNGADVIYGGGGDDWINGGDHGDEIFGNRGSDTLRGAAGADTLEGGGGADTLAGELGADLLSGGRHADILVGGSGDDELLGGKGADTLSGKDGDDILIGGSGIDHADGGAGTDVCVAEFTTECET